MNPIHLRTHEINHELRVCGIATSSVDMPQKRRYLKRELQKDMARPGVHVYPLPNFNFKTEKKEIEESIKSITSLVDDFDDTNKNVYERIRSRLVHIIGRVKRVPQDVNDMLSDWLPRDQEEEFLSQARLRRTQQLTLTFGNLSQQEAEKRRTRCYFCGSYGKFV